MNEINGKDLSRFMGLGEEAEEMRSRQHSLKLSNETVINLGYLCKEMLETVTGCKAWLFFEQANGYSSCFKILRQLLKVVDPEYLAVHHHLAEFFKEGHELERNGDKLSFVNVPAAKQAEDVSTNPVPPTVEMKTNTRPAKLRKKIEKGLRHHLISKLTDGRAKMVPVYEYSVGGSYTKDSHRNFIDVIESDMTFEPGDPDTRVKVLVKPDTLKNDLVETLYAIAETASDHKGENWTAELDDAVGKVGASLKRVRKQ